MADEKGFGYFLKFPFSKMSESIKPILLGYVPIINFASVGYVMESARNVSKKKYELPKFSEFTFGQLFMMGLMALGIIIVYSIIPNLLSRVTDYWSKNLSQTGVVVSVFVLVSIASFIVSILFYLMMSAALLRFVRSNNFSEGFEFKAVWKEGVNWDFFKKALLAGVASVILMIPFIVVCVFGFVGLAVKFGIMESLKAGTFDPSMIVLQPALWIFLFVLYVLYIPSIYFSWTCYYSYLMHQTSGSAVVKAGVSKTVAVKAEEQKESGLAIASFVVSILNLFGLFVVVIPVLVSLILSVVSLVKISNNPKRYGGKGFAIAALVLSILELLMAIGFIMLIAFIAQNSNVVV